MFKIRLPKKIRQIVWIIGLVSVIGSSIFFSQDETDKVQPTEPAVASASVKAEERTSAVVNRVVDGDTIEVLINEEKFKVRLIGIDTPETVDPRRPVECFGKEASNRLKELIDGKQVILEMDSSQGEQDRYSRLLRYIFIDEVNINHQMVQEGYASEYTYSAPYRYQNEFVEAQRMAMAENRGLWNPETCVVE